jgi:hypothetical protein
MKVKTLVTIYRDYDSDYADMDNPKYDYPWYRVGEDYDFIRRGAILTAYTRKEYFENEDETDGVVLASDKHKFYLTLDSLDDIRKNKHWYQIIEE